MSNAKVIKKVTRLEQHQKKKTLSHFHKLKMCWNVGKENSSTLPPTSNRGSTMIIGIRWSIVRIFVETQIRL